MFVAPIELGTGFRGKLLEAMACGVPAVVYGPSGFDGCAEEYWELRKNNYSGRRYHKDLTSESLRYELLRAEKMDTNKCLRYVWQNHNPEKIINELLSL